MEDKHFFYMLDCVDSFFLMFSKRLNVIEFIIKLELLRDYCIKNRNGAVNSFTIRRQIAETEKLKLNM